VLVAIIYFKLQAVGKTVGKKQKAPKGAYSA